LGHGEGAGVVRYLQQRALSAVVVLVGVSMLTFFMMHMLPGDPIDYMFAMSQGEPPSAEQVQELRHQLGLDQPLLVQYTYYLRDAMQGDLGRSIFLKRDVVDIIRDNFRYTLELTIAGLIFAMALGFILGIVAAAKRGTWIDSATMAISLVGLSMPFFWLALLLVLLFSLKLDWLPATGQGSIKQLILPAIAIGITSAGTIARLVRSSMLEVLRQEYIVTARAKGVRESRVLVRHALRNAIIPPITVAGLQFGRLMGGAVVTETIFARKGLGTVLVDGILSHDFKLVQGILLFIALVYILINFIVDMSYAFIDPRIRYA
jgi:ABC-type dipeptide/oligopeptide/nickel transport system permease component